MKEKEETDLMPNQLNYVPAPSFLQLPKVNVVLNVYRNRKAY